MAPATNGIDGDRNAKSLPSPGPGPKNHRSLRIVYIDHELDKLIAASADDRAKQNINRPNLTVVNTEHHLDHSVPSDTGQGSSGSDLLASQDAVTRNQQGLSRFSAELRLMIWELLLPGKRLLRARAWYGRDSASHVGDGSASIKGSRGRWYFRVYGWEIEDVEGHGLRLEIPNVLKICRESRSVALRRGLFIFSQRGKSRETGTWWNPDLDVLGFHHSWDLDQHPWALAHLHGLEHVKRIAIDEQHAWTMCYKAGYNGRDPLDIPRKLREPLALGFEFRAWGARNHYIAGFFPRFQQLSILFSTIYRQKLAEAIGKEWRSIWSFSIEEHAYSVTFELGSDIQTAVKELRRYRKLCMKTRVREPEWDLMDTFVNGPIYSVKDDGVDVDHLDHWMTARFGMCQMDQEVPI